MPANSVNTFSFQIFFFRHLKPLKHTGAMVFVVIEELIPEATRNEKTDICTIGFSLGFALMMVLDVALG